MHDRNGPRRVHESGKATGSRAVNLIGYRCGTHAGLTAGLFGTEGEGLYVATTPELAEEFYVSPDSIRYTLRVTLQNALYVAGYTVSEILNDTENNVIEQPPSALDDQWLAAHKQAFALMKDEPWDEGRFNHLLTAVLKRWGYDGVYFDGPGDGSYSWVVVFDPKNARVVATSEGKWEK